MDTGEPNISLLYQRRHASVRGHSISGCFHGRWSRRQPKNWALTKASAKQMKGAKIDFFNCKTYYQDRTLTNHL